MTAQAGFVPDLLGPEHDAPATNKRAKPSLSYLVCSTPRSGSGLLCRGLAAAGSFGAPIEYFNPLHRHVLSERWGCETDLHSYLRSLHVRRTSADGLFGSKLHWAQMARLRAEFDPRLEDESDSAFPYALFEAVFPAPRFVRIVRDDGEAQAISYWRALSSNVWSVNAASLDSPPDPPPYDFDGIESCRKEIRTGDSCWDWLLSSAEIEPLTVTYEELDCRYEATIERVASYIDPRQPVRPLTPSTRKLSDKRSIEFKERFIADSRTRSRLSTADPK
jgi:LPS sulfotransferase NodH